MPWLSSSSGTAVTVDTSSCLMKWGYKTTFQQVARVPLQLGGSTPHQGRRSWSIKKPDMEGYLPIIPPFWSCKPWLSHGLQNQKGGLMGGLSTGTSLWASAQSVKCICTSVQLAATCTSCSILVTFNYSRVMNFCLMCCSQSYPIEDCSHCVWIKAVSNPAQHI